MYFNKILKQPNISSCVFTSVIALASTFINHSKPEFFHLPSTLSLINKCMQHIIKSWFWYLYIPSVCAITLLSFTIPYYYDNASKSSNINKSIFELIYLTFTNDLCLKLACVNILNFFIGFLAFSDFDPSGHVRVLMSSAFIMANFVKNMFEQKDKLKIESKSIFLSLTAISLLYVLPSTISLFCAAHFFHSQAEVIAGITIGVLVNTASDKLVNHYLSKPNK